MASNKIEGLIEHLRGTCKSLDEGCEQLFDHDSTELTLDECGELDEAIFCCETCGWWCERSEESEGEPGHCDECEPGESDDD